MPTDSAEEDICKYPGMSIKDTVAERQLIDVTVVRRVRPRAERSCTNE